MAASSSLDPCQISSSPSSTTYSTPHYRIPNSIVQISGNFAPDTIIPISGEFAPDTIVQIPNTVWTPLQMAGAAALGLVALPPPKTGNTIVQISGNFPVTGRHFFDGDGMIHAISDDTSDFSPESDIQSNLTLTPTNNKRVIYTTDVLPVYNINAMGKAQSICKQSPITSDRWSSSVIALYNQHELGKAILGFAIPVITGLLSMHSISNPILLNLVVVSLCIGFVCIWIGLQTRALVPRVAIRLEQFGVATVLAAFFGLVSKFVPVYLIWAPWACWALSLLPFALTLF